MPLTQESATQVTEAYYDGAEMVPQKYRQAFLDRDDDVPSIREAAVYGITALEEWPSGDLPQARLHTLGTKSINYVEFGLQLRIRKRQVRDNPMYLRDGIMALGRAVENTRSIICAAVLNNAFSTATCIPGSKPLYATDHPTKGGTRSNKLSSAPDLAGIFAAHTLARNWVDYDDSPYDLADLGWNIIHPTASGLEQMIGQAIGSQVTSDQNQVNLAGSYNLTQIPYSRITDATHAHMWSKAVKPGVFWERDGVEETMDADEDSKEIKVSIDVAWGVYLRGQPTGAIGFDS
jgi:hypothetical protein